jgi:hypothetical protein
MVAYDSPHSLLDRVCIVFHCGWLGSDLRIGPFFYCDCLERRLSYKCQRVELSWTELTSRRPEYRSPPRTFHVILPFRCQEMCLPNLCSAIDYSVSICCGGNVYLLSRWLAMDFRSDSTIPAFKQCLLNRCLAMVIVVTILTKVVKSGHAHKSTGRLLSAFYFVSLYTISLRFSQRSQSNSIFYIVSVFGLGVWRLVLGCLLNQGLGRKQSGLIQVILWSLPRRSRRKHEEPQSRSTIPPAKIWIDIFRMQIYSVTDK